MRYYSIFDRYFQCESYILRFAIIHAIISVDNRFPGGKNMYRDLTRGPIARSLVLFALPMMAGNLLQQFYNIADTLIVGRALGTTRWRRWARPTR